MALVFFLGLTLTVHVSYFTAVLTKPGKGLPMGLAYEDLLQPYIVKQVTKSVAYCRCTRTKNPPFCDGSHVVTNITPRVLEFEEPKTIAICACWKSKTHPYCDGTHGRLVKPKERRTPKSAD